MPVGLIAGLIAVLTASFSTSKLDDRLHLTPNQGIWHSARNGLFVGLIFGLIFGLMPPLVALGFGLFFGLLAGSFATLFFGLGAFFQHFDLRFWLRCTNSLPWNLVAFLDEATKRLLLRKVGGGYIFIHQLLLNYFAELGEKDGSHRSQ